MIFGVFERNRKNKIDADRLAKVAAQNVTTVGDPVRIIKDNFAAFYQPHFKGRFYQRLAPVSTKDGVVVAVMQGKIYNATEMAAQVSTEVPDRKSVV